MLSTTAKTIFKELPTDTYKSSDTIPINKALGKLNQNVYYEMRPGFIIECKIAMICEMANILFDDLLKLNIDISLLKIKEHNKIHIVIDRFINLNKKEKLVVYSSTEMGEPLFLTNDEEIKNKIIDKCEIFYRNYWLNEPIGHGFHLNEDFFLTLQDARNYACLLTKLQAKRPFKKVQKERKRKTNFINSTRKDDPIKLKTDRCKVYPNFYQHSKGIK